MIKQPGGTDLYKETTGQYVSAMMDIFESIEQYHITLNSGMNEDSISQHRTYVLAIMAEATELLEAVPWKPWRPDNYKPVDKLNIAEEIIDIIFFLGNIRETWEISNKQLADVLENKLIENSRRLTNGYNRTN